VLIRSMNAIKKLGFTLIELLVVIAILGILATVGLGSFQSSQMKGRDAQRKSDLSQIQKALEMYYNDKGAYPTSIPVRGNEWRDTSVTGGTLYMKSVPGDPKGGDYCYESDGTYYKLYAKLENTKDPAIEKTGCANCACSCGGQSGYCYKVTSPNAP